MCVGGGAELCQLFKHRRIAFEKTRSIAGKEIDSSGKVMATSKCVYRVLWLKKKIQRNIIYQVPIKYI